MLAAIVKDSVVAAAIATDERFLIDDLGEAHMCYYLHREWSTDDVAKFQADAGCEIDTASAKFNAPVDVEIYKVPNHLTRHEIRAYYEDLRDWPEPVKTIRLYPAPVV